MIKREKTLEKTRISSGNSYLMSIRVFDFFSNFFLSFFAFLMGKITHSEVVQGEPQLDGYLRHP
jgi:hypothetical protein